MSWWNFDAPDRRLLGGAETELARSRTPGIARLHQHRGLGQRSLLNLEAHFGVAAGIGENLGIVRSGVGASETKREPGAFDSGAAFGDAEVHQQIAAGVH